MTVALQFSGSDYLTHDGFSIGSADDFSIRIKVSSLSNAAHTRWIGGSTYASTQPRIIFLANTGVVRFNGDSSNREWAIGLDVTIMQEIEFRRTLGRLDLYIDGALQTGGFDLNTDTVTNSRIVGANFGAATQQGRLEYLKVDINGTPELDLSPTLSDHSNTGSQPVMIDTVAGNNATGVGFPTDGSVWVDLDDSGTEQSITIATTQQLTQSETVSVMGIGFANAIISESIIQSQLVSINETAQLNAIVSEQKTESTLQALATINNVSSVICEQLNESSTVSNESTQLVYAVQAQQLTQSLNVNVSGDGTQSVDVIVTEQKSQSQTITLEEVASIKAVTCEQLAQAVNANVSAINETNAITAEQLSQSITVSVDESSGIFVSVVHTEQLSESTLADINADSIINAIITQQLTQTSTQHINVDITLDAVICEQLTHAELITIIEQNISQQLSIDIDQITIEILTPTHEIEMLTPTYTIEHL
ncbi:hypothetical protein Q4503_16440 [Colwellia sp. 6_MG-2023]|uniref:hypothetical protein n=1 Tax=Colwellia sp. 6_MG-2023 TaxID=3062676 RepID=UPI0026E42029|nr:hypothetical protein [Colwellia sp. 6_MG-2023]MDO6489285.1 hypothetical protein [Colwellia sp. 6_MG-2023]